MKNCLYLFSTCLQYVLEQEIISSELFVRCGGGGDKYETGHLEHEAVKGNIIGNGLKIWVVTLQIK
jgi:hypothetical protein